MLFPRVGHGSVLLGNWSVLVAGGGSPWAETYDPSHNRWLPAGLSGVRYSAAMLLRGRNGVLMAGGETAAGDCMASAVVFIHNSWTPVQAMSSPRCAALATALPDGSDVVGGGFGSDTWASLQRMVPGALSWSYFPSLGIPRCAGTLTYVGHGVLATGGRFEGTEIGIARVPSFVGTTFHVESSASEGRHRGVPRSVSWQNSQGSDYR